MTPPQCEFEVSPSNLPVSAGQPGSPLEILTDAELVTQVRALIMDDLHIQDIINAAQSPAKCSRFSTKDGIVYKGHWIVGTANNSL